MCYKNAHFHLAFCFRIKPRILHNKGAITSFWFDDILHLLCKPMKSDYWYHEKTAPQGDYQAGQTAGTNNLEVWLSVDHCVYPRVLENSEIKIAGNHAPSQMFSRNPWV